MTRDETKKILMAIKAVYPLLVVDQTVIDVWQALLGNHAYAVIQDATMGYLREPHDFAPTPGKILARISDKVRAVGIDPDDAWNQAVAVCSPHKRKERSLLSPAVVQAAERVGWDRIAYANVDKELPFVRKTFLESYKTFIDRKMSKALEIGVASLDEAAIGVYHDNQLLLENDND